MKTLLQNRLASMVHAFGDEERKSAVRLLASDVASVERQLSEANELIRQLREAGSDLHAELTTARYRLRMLGSGTCDLPGNAAMKRWGKLAK